MDGSTAREALALMALAATVLAAVANIAVLQQSRLRFSLGLILTLVALSLVVYVLTSFRTHKAVPPKEVPAMEPPLTGRAPAPDHPAAPGAPQVGRQADGREPIKDIQLFLIGEWTAAQPSPDDQRVERNACDWTFLDATVVRDNRFGFLRQYEITKVQGNEVLLRLDPPHDASGPLQRLFMLDKRIAGSQDVQVELMRIVLDRAANQFDHDGRKCVRR